MRDIIGIVLPPIIDLVNQKVASAQARFWIAMVFCVVVAFLANIEEFVNLDWNVMLGKVALIFTESQIIYKVYWEKATLRDKLFTKRVGE